MADANEVQFEMGPPLSEAEAKLIWYAPAGGLSAALIVVLFMDLAIVVILLISQMFLLGVALLSTVGPATSQTATITTDSDLQVTMMSVQEFATLVSDFPAIGDRLRQLAEERSSASDPHDSSKP